MPVAGVVPWGAQATRHWSLNYRFGSSERGITGELLFLHAGCNVLGSG
jgi:hypothetical protein